MGKKQIVFDKADYLLRLYEKCKACGLLTKEQASPRFQVIQNNIQLIRKGEIKVNEFSLTMLWIMKEEIETELNSNGIISEIVPFGREI